MLRNLTFGDFEGLSSPTPSIVCAPSEAVLIVRKKTVSLQAVEQGADPFVCAVAGPEREVLPMKERYEKNPMLEVYYVPAQET